MLSPVLVISNLSECTERMFSCYVHGASLQGNRCITHTGCQTIADDEAGHLDHCQCQCHDSMCSLFVVLTHVSDMLATNRV